MGRPTIATRISSPCHPTTFKSDFLLKALDYTYNYANLGGGFKRVNACGGGLPTFIRNIYCVAQAEAVQH